MTNPRFQVLLVGTKPQLPDDFSRRVKEETQNEILAEETSAVSDALARVSEKGYDAVACWAENESDLAAVIRIRKARPDVPIVVVSSKDDERFEGLARQAGATRTALPSPDTPSLSRFLLEVLRSGELRREMLVRSRWVRSQSREVHELAQETHALSRRALKRSRPWMPRRFEPLLVEDDSDHAFFFMTHAFLEAGVTAPHPVQRSVEEAIAYLSAHREAGNLPSMVLVDLELGANSFLIKPTGTAALLDLVQMLKAFWGGHNEPPEQKLP